MRSGVPILPARFRNLTYTIDGRSLVDDVSLTLETGEITLIMGPNGAGKSLLLRMLHGLIEPVRGEATWTGTLTPKELRLRQAMVFQRPVMLRRSVAANLEFALKLRGIDDPSRRDEILATVGLETQASQPARRLSGGEQQRLALARALATEPDILFLDEPTAHLDPASTAAIEDIVRGAHDGGTKIVFVTHDFGQARRLGGEIVFMHRGRILEQTPTSQFFDTPNSPEARQFLSGGLVL